MADGHDEHSNGLWLWSLREDVLVEADPDTRDVVIVSSYGETRLGVVSPAVLDLLQRMTFGPVSLTNALRRPQDIEEGERVLEALAGCVIRSLSDSTTGTLLLSAIPITRCEGLDIRPLPPDRLVRLSRFTAMRSCEGAVWMESPLADYRFVLHDQIPGAIAGSLGGAVSASDVAKTLGRPLQLVTEVVAGLVAAGLARVADEACRFAEDHDPGLSLWAFHELLFHGRTRLGRQDSPLAVSAKYRARVAVHPVLKPSPDGPRFALPQRAPASGAHDSGRLSAGKLGELLYRTARVRSIAERVDDDRRYEVSDRPYPSSHGLYELELYLSTNGCGGLPDGMYHYDPAGHLLTLVNDSAAVCAAMLDEARIAAREPRRAAALITITARIGRLSRQFCGVAYATSLRHVGLLQGRLHDVSAALRLAGRASAPVNEPLIRSALGLTWPAEVAVGDFILLGQSAEVAGRRDDDVGARRARVSRPSG